jgi:hypothetical protein
LATYDSGKSWEKIMNKNSSRLNFHMSSSWIYFNISPLESSELGHIIANGSDDSYLFFPNIHELSGKYIYEGKEINTFYSNDFGESFKKVILYIN